MLKPTTLGARATLLAIAGALTSCGVVNSQDFKDLSGKKSDDKGSTAGAASDKVEITIQLKEESSKASLTGDGLSLVNATGFVMDISACTSGYTATGITSVASTKAITLYKHDRSCQADLTSFTFGGATYTKVGGGNLAGTSGSTGLFVNGSDANDKVMVRAHTVLPSPLTDGSTATFVFQQWKKGSDHNIANYTFSETLEVVGVEAPNVTINDVSLTAIANDGKATFEVTFQCGNTMTQPASDWICPSAGNDNHKIVNMKAKLITDTYTGTIDYSDAVTIMTAGTTTLANADKVGGQERFKVSVTGQGALYSNKNMLLVLSYEDPSSPSLGTSYKYFNVDIGDP